MEDYACGVCNFLYNTRYSPCETRAARPRDQALNMVRFQELYGGMPGVVVPRVLLDYSGKRVLTSEWVDGEKVRSRCLAVRAMFRRVAKGYALSGR